MISADLNGGNKKEKILEMSSEMQKCYFQHLAEVIQAKLEDRNPRIREKMSFQYKMPQKLKETIDYTPVKL
jgi:hypothetical protein